MLTDALNALAPEIGLAPACVVCVSIGPGSIAKMPGAAACSARPCNPRLGLERHWH